MIDRPYISFFLSYKVIIYVLKYNIKTKKEDQNYSFFFSQNYSYLTKSTVLVLARLKHLNNCELCLSR